MTTDQDPGFSPPFLQENSSAFDSGLALQLLSALHLNSASLNSANHQFAATMESCSKCSTSNKRQSPSSLSPHQPSAKRAALLQPSSSTKSDEDQLLHGFTRIPLSSPGLSRTLSAPIPSLGTNNLNDRPSNGALANASINNLLPEESYGVNSAPLPTASQQPLYRSFSEPIPDSYQLVAATTTCRAPAAGEATRQPPSTGDAPVLSLKQESPDAKRLKRMRDRMREMSKWWDEVIKEGEGDADSENNDRCVPKFEQDDTEASQVNQTEEACQEAVWVESKGELLILHFKCPCGKGYQILLCGNNCYYKLTSF